MNPDIGAKCHFVFFPYCSLYCMTYSPNHCAALKDKKENSLTLCTHFLFVDQITHTETCNTTEWNIQGLAKAGLELWLICETEFILVLFLY